MYEITIYEIFDMDRKVQFRRMLDLYSNMVTKYFSVVCQTFKIYIRTSLLTLVLRNFLLVDLKSRLNIGLTSKVRYSYSNFRKKVMCDFVATTPGGWGHCLCRSDR